MTDEELNACLDERQGAVAIRNELETQIEGCTEKIKGALKARGRKKLVAERWVPQIVVQERKTLDPKKLLQAGVLVTVIEACTTINPVESLRVAPRGPEDKN